MRLSNTAIKELKKRYKDVLIKCLMINALIFGAFSSGLANAADPITDRPVFIFGDISLNSQDVKKGEAAFAGRRMEWVGDKYVNNFPKYQMEGRSFEITNSDIYVGPISLTLQEIDTTEKKFTFNYQWDLTDRDIAADSGVTWNEDLKTVTTKVANVIGEHNASYTAPNVFLFAQITEKNDAGTLIFDKTTAMIDGATITANKINVANSSLTIVCQNKDKLTAFADSQIDSDGQTTLIANTINLSNTTIKINSDAKLLINAKESGAFNKTDIANDGALSFHGNVNLDGNISGNGSVTFAKGANLTAELNKTTILASSVTFEGENTINLTVQNGLADADYDFITAKTLTGNENVSFTENALYNLTLTDNGKINISTKSGEEIKESLGEEVSTQEADAISAMIQTNGSSTEKGNELASLISSAIQEGNAQTAVEAVKQAAPTTAQVTQGVAKEAAGTVARLASGRMAAVKGRSGGDIAEGAGLWVQALYNHTKQNATSSSDGFKADSEGIALGVDKEVSENVTLGIGYGYMKTDVDSYGREMDVDGHNFFLYGKYQPSQWYVSSVLSYNYSKYTEKKTPMGVNLRSEYDVNSYSAQMMTGYEYQNGWTPEAGLRYLVVDADSYFDGMQRVSSDKDDVLTAVVGLKYETTRKANCLSFKPYARVALTYDVLSDNATANVLVSGGGNYRTESQRLHRFGAEADLGITATVKNVDVTLEYNGAFRQDYTSQGGMLKLRYHF